MSQPTRRTDVPGTIYIGRFEQPIGNPDARGGTAQFYVGWSEGDVAQRWEAHMSGEGANITGYVAAQGMRIEFRVLEENVTRERERQIKNNGHYSDKIWPRTERSDTRRQTCEPKTDRAQRAMARRRAEAARNR